MCVVSCLMSHGPSREGRSLKSTISELLFPKSNASSLLCKARCVSLARSVCVCVCVRTGRQVDSACRGRKSQAGSSCSGTSHWGPRVSASSVPLPPSCLTPGVFCIDMGGLHSLTHTLTHTIYCRANAHREATDGCLSEIRCEMKY